MLIKPFSKHSCINKTQSVSFHSVFSKPSKYKLQKQEMSPRYSSSLIRISHVQVLGSLDECFSCCFSQCIPKGFTNISQGGPLVNVCIDLPVYVEFPKDRSIH